VAGAGFPILTGSNALSAGLATILRNSRGGAEGSAAGSGARLAERKAGVAGGATLRRSVDYTAR
jgi:hypothetical protein